jgi:fructokinase
MRLGIDWGGTKIEIIALDDTGAELFRQRSATPKDDYEGCIRVVKDLVDAAESATGQTGSLGLGIPGSLSPKTGVVKNANSTWMNGKPLDKDLEAALNRSVRIQNDANCLAVSEATDGAGAGAHVVHAIIIGTGSGSGIAIDAKAHLGANGIGGEWGGIALPWMTAEEFPGPDSWIGHKGVIDLWCSGTGFQWDYKERTGHRAERS